MADPAPHTLSAFLASPTTAPPQSLRLGPDDAVGAWASLCHRALRASRGDRGALPPLLGVWAAAIDAAVRGGRVGAVGGAMAALAGVFAPSLAAIVGARDAAPAAVVGWIEALVEPIHAMRAGDKESLVAVEDAEGSVVIGALGKAVAQGRAGEAAVQLARSAIALVVLLMRGSRGNKDVVASVAPPFLATALTSTTDVVTRTRCVEAAFRLYQHDRTTLNRVLQGSTRASVEFRNAIATLPQDSEGRFVSAVQRAIAAYDGAFTPPRTYHWPCVRAEATTDEEGRREVCGAAWVVFDESTLVLLTNFEGGMPSVTVPYERVRSVKLSRNRTIAIRCTGSSPSAEDRLREGEALVLHMSPDALAQLRHSPIQNWISAKKSIEPAKPESSSLSAIDANMTRGGRESNKRARESIALVRDEPSQKETIARFAGSSSRRQKHLQLLSDALQHIQNLTDEFRRDQRMRRAALEDDILAMLPKTTAQAAGGAGKDLPLLNDELQRLQDVLAEIPALAGPLAGGKGSAVDAAVAAVDGAERQILQHVKGVAEEMLEGLQHSLEDFVEAVDPIRLMTTLVERDV